MVAYGKKLHDHNKIADLHRNASSAPKLDMFILALVEITCCDRLLRNQHWSIHEALHVTCELFCGENLNTDTSFTLNVRANVFVSLADVSVTKLALLYFETDETLTQRKQLVVIYHGISFNCRNYLVSEFERFEAILER